MKINYLSFLITLLFFSNIVESQNQTDLTPQSGDYKSVGGTETNPNPWRASNSWRVYDGANWSPASDFPLSNTFSGRVFIDAGTFIEYSVTSMTNGFDLNGAIIVNGNFNINIPTNSNTNFAGAMNIFVLNNGGVFSTTFGKNPSLEVRVNQLFRINGGELKYLDGGNNSALFIECKGDVEINGGLLINNTNGSLNNSGLYMSGAGTEANPQNIRITSNISVGARNRFFGTSGTFILENYSGSVEQNTVYGNLAQSRSGYLGFQNKTNALTINNSSASGVNLSNNRTVTDTLKLLDGHLNNEGNTLTISNDATIEKSGGELNFIPSFGTSLDLLYSQHSAIITFGNEVPSADIINNLTVNSTNGVSANTDIKVNSQIDLIEGLLQLNTQRLIAGSNITKVGGSIDAIDAIVEFTSNSDQIIDPSSFIDNTIKHIINSGSGGPNLSSELKVSDLLEINSGTFKSNGELTMLASPAHTAQIGPVNGDIVGEVTVEQFYPARRAFRFVSSPVTTTTTIRENWQEGVNNTGLNFPEDNKNPNEGYGVHISGSLTGANGFDATGSGNPSLFQFINSGTNRGWIAITNTDSQSLSAGTPYRLMIRGDRSINVTSNDAVPKDTRLRNTGIVVTGGSSQSTLSPNQGDFNFIGNPYQAMVDMDMVLQNSTNLSTTEYYIWDPTLSDRGAYVTIDPATGDNAIYPNTLSSGNDFANEFLQPMQGAFVRTEADGSASISFEQSYIDVNATQTTTKTSAANDYINIQLYQAERFSQNAKPTDGLRINFHKSYLISSNDDSPKLGNLDENLARTVNNKIIALERRPIPKDEEELKLFINQYRNEDYILKFDVTNSLNLQIYVKDKYLDKMSEVTPNQSTYSFSVDPSIAESVASDRLSLIVDPVRLSVAEENLKLIRLYPNPTRGSFTIAGEFLKKDTQVKIYNILGQQLYMKKSKGSQSFIVADIGLKPGIYLVNIKNENSERTFKLIKE